MLKASANRYQNDQPGADLQRATKTASGVSRRTSEQQLNRAQAETHLLAEAAYSSFIVPKLPILKAAMKISDIYMPKAKLQHATISGLSTSKITPKKGKMCPMFNATYSPCDFEVC